MVAVISLLIVLALSMLIMRVASVILEHTGLSREVARFQARSSFTGTGFTTTEAEGLMANPIRRRVVMALMLLGNAGIVTAISSLMLSFLDRDRESTLRNVSFLLTGVGILWLVAIFTKDLLLLGPQFGDCSRNIRVLRWTGFRESRENCRLFGMCRPGWNTLEPLRRHVFLSLDLVGRF